MKTIKITIRGMSCQHCAKAVKNGLESLDGVKSASVSLKDENASIEYDGAKVSLEQMKDVIQDCGYEVIG